MSLWRFALVGSFLLCFGFQTWAQEQKTDTSSTSKIIRNDTVSVARQTKSPLGAMLRSFVLPGWGQVYVHQYWKAPLFLGGAVVMYYYTLKHHNDFLDYSRQYDQIATENPQDPRLYILKIRRENSRDNRDISTFFLLAVYGISMLDAYVDAHLFGFNVSENVAINIIPSNLGLKFSVSIFTK
ncbi:hypothetical protein D9V84_01525 [Bacteroidetes/Chlorobi group bacterium Naka2016]|jgi:hypothetical protein|nr:MAG: hypothetical protein D9V84_01525 [Bacteroidetes/Chlorobi group bacterium Naka2016]